jgi:hypothetical protein
MSQPKDQPKDQPPSHEPVQYSARYSLDAKYYGSSSPEYRLGRVFVFIDMVGKSLMGDLWRPFYESVQDAIALGLILQIPNFIGRVLLGVDFSSLDACFRQSGFSVERYACITIVASNIALWTVLAGRLLGRIATVRLIKRRRNSERQDSEES